MEAFLVSFLLGYKVWLKFFFSSLKEKEKNQVKVSQEESGRLRSWENEKWIIYKEIEKGVKNGWRL